MSVTNVWNRLYKAKTGNFRPRTASAVNTRRKLGMRPTKYAVPLSSSGAGSNSVMPYHGASYRPQTGYELRRKKMTRLYGMKRVPSASTKIVITNSLQRPKSASPYIVVQRIRVCWNLWIL